MIFLSPSSDEFVFCYSTISPAVYFVFDKYKNDFHFLESFDSLLRMNKSFNFFVSQKGYFLKSFLNFRKCYVSLTFVSSLFVESLSDWRGSYTTWIWPACCAFAAAAAAAAMLCWWAQDSDVTLRDLISGGFLLLIDVENAKPRRRVALWSKQVSKYHEEEAQHVF